MVIQREDGECSKNALNEDTDRVPSTIIACCVLHNICLLANDDTDIDPVDSDVDGDGDQGDANDVGSRRLVLKKNCFSAWASTLNMGLINKVDMVCLSPVGYGV